MGVEIQRLGFNRPAKPLVEEEASIKLTKQASLHFPNAEKMQHRNCQFKLASPLLSRAIVYQLLSPNQLNIVKHRENSILRHVAVLFLIAENKICNHLMKRAV